MQKQIEQKDYKKEKTTKNIDDISKKIKNIELILGQSNQDILALSNALKQLTKRSEMVHRDKLKLQSDLLEIEDQIDILDDADVYS